LVSTHIPTEEEEDEVAQEEIYRVLWKRYEMQFPIKT
jgi:hypothetical protein